MSTANGAGTRRDAGQGKNKPGHYRIEGYTINLDYDDGSKSSALFYWAGGGSQHVICEHGDR